MKKIILCALCLAPLSLLAQDEYTLVGKVGKLNPPAKAFLSYRKGSTNVLDSTVINNGKFQFKGNVDGVSVATLRIKHNDAPVDPKSRVANDVKQVYLEKGKIMVVAADSVKRAKITGSVINLDADRLNGLLKSIDDEIASLMKEYTAYTPEQKKDEAVMKPFMEKYNAANSKKEPILKNFAKDNPNSYIGLSAFRNTLGMDVDPDVVEPQFLKFSEKVRSTQLGKDVAMTINGARKTQIGTVTDFTQNDADGKPVKLSDFKGKYVLVDFWASWCGPCRAENPNVVAAYNKFKDKNFTVLGVSLDGGNTRTTKEAWLKAVEADHLTWTQVSDLQGWENVVSKSYGVRGIPFNFLVDPTGKIVAKNLRGESLTEKLTEIIDGKAK